MIGEIHSLILKALNYSLFGGEKPKLNSVDIKDLVKESKAQSVFTYIFSTFKDEIKDISPREFAKLNLEFLTQISNSIRVHTEHGELHQIMLQSGIPYVVLKGCASSAYYKEPDLRAMGDVDFLVHEADIPKGIAALEASGFVRDQYEFTTNQSAYHRPPMSIWEIHKSPSGIPKGIEGNPIRRELENIIETAELNERNGISFLVPNKYYHGIILLLHKISHMTTTGIGLRHLCDWAVFESSFENDEFSDMFETKLIELGIWKFAQIMTLVCEKYLGTPKRKWAENPEIDESLIDDVMLDILSGGNFGKKDGNRQREIKYISDREQGRLGNKGIFAQAINSLNSKVYSNNKVINKYKILLPVGWIIEGSKYFGLLISGRRKNSDSFAMLKEVSKRKNIYKNMEIFISK